MAESSSKRRKTVPQKVSDPNLPIEDVELMDVTPSALSDQENAHWLYEMEVRRRNPAIFKILDRKSPEKPKAAPATPAVRVAPPPPVVVSPVSPDDAMMQMVRERVKPKRKRPTFSRRLQSLPMPDSMRVAERTELFVRLIVVSSEQRVDVRDRLPKLAEVDIPLVMRRIAELSEMSFREIAALFYAMCKAEMARCTGQDVSNLIQVVRAIDAEVQKQNETAEEQAGPSINRVVEDLREAVGQQQAARNQSQQVTINRGTDDAPPAEPDQSNATPETIASFILWKHR